MHAFIPCFLVLHSNTLSSYVIRIAADRVLQYYTDRHVMCVWSICSTDAYVQLFGPQQAEAIVLPPCENYMNVEVQRTVASKMLTRGLQRGLVIHSENNNIYVYRLCQ